VPAIDSGAQQSIGEEQTMCPVCIASSAAMIAGAGSTGGILAVCLLKFRKAFKLIPVRDISKKTTGTMTANHASEVGSRTPVISSEEAAR
jgi:hypothetical protein